MRRACYRKKPEGYEFYRLKAIRKDGSVETEPIKEVGEQLFPSLDGVVMEINRLGYGIVGNLDDIRRENESRAYEKRCGENMMDIDEL